MKVRLLVFLAVGVITAMMIGLAGCSGDEGPAGVQGPQGDPGPAQVSIVASITADYYSRATVEYLCVAGITNAPTIPNVTVNDQEILLDGEWLIGGGRLGYYNWIDLDEAVTSTHLAVSYTDAEGSPALAEATVNLPDTFSEVTYPIYVVYGNDMEAEWHSSSGADAYWVYCDFDFDYYDTAGAYHSIDMEFDTVVGDTTLNVLGSRVFPDMGTVQSVSYFDGDFYIAAVAGPWLPGEQGNITGDGIGVFLSASGDVYIDVAQAPLSTVSEMTITDEREIDRAAVAERLNQRIEALKSAGPAE